MTHRLHDDVVWLFAQTLRQAGHRVATEAGIPGGRIDLVRLDETDKWIELYEVKVRQPEAGFAQLETYAAVVGGKPRKTLVVPPALATGALRAEAATRGARVHVFDYKLGVQQSIFRDDGYDRWVHLPYIHPQSVAVMAERWKRERTAA